MRWFRSRSKNRNFRFKRSFDLFVNRHFVVVRTKLLDLQPFGGVPTILFSGVSRYTLRTFFGAGPAFGALESDNDPDALVLGHKDVTPRLRSE